MRFSVNFPINPVSFGQVSTLLMRGFKAKGLEPSLFPIGNGIDVSSQEDDPEFTNYLSKCAQSSYITHDRNDPTLKLWHFNGGLESFSKSLNLFTFYELDQPTKVEINVAKNCDQLLFSNKYTQEIFKQFDIESTVIPLAFDEFNFSQKF